MQDLTAPEQAWHAEPAEAALERFQSSAQGLSSEEAARRLETDGPNRLPAHKSRSLLARVLAQFNNLLIYVLLASSAVTILLRHALDAIVILAVVLINAAIGFIQEGRAEQALEAIRAMLTREASVLRDGHRLTVPAESLVAGDVVLTEAGDRIPADLRLLRATSLRIEEAVLTGEAAAADKSVEPVAPDAALGDRASMAYSGTLVASGQGAGLVVATGAATELGRISAMVGGVETLTTPLLRQMNVFAQRLTIVILALAACVCVFAFMARGYEIEHAFMAAVGVAVSAIPEGLPAVMTITLAIGVKRMADRNAIIRSLPAVETLGAVSTICSDKTGTLTLNQMTVGAVLTASAEFETTGTGYDPRGDLLRGGGAIDPGVHPDLGAIARASLLCNDASLRQAGADWIVDGDPMEGALIAFAIKAGADPDKTKRESPRLKEIPFDSRHRFMATLNPVGAESLISIKGAPERMLELCGSQRGAGGDDPLDTPAWRVAIDKLAARGQRVIAFASKPARDSDRLELADVEEGGLTLLGLVGLVDPPRPEAVQAIAECKAAGIDVKMITGDHASTGAAIARELGLGKGAVDALTGHTIDTMDEAALRRSLPTTSVFARTSPEHKLRLVEALQADGAVVSMTGDGVNDAPALKRANVGVAMGRKGTEAAKEAAEMVLADDNFATITAAVREGRIVYDNLVKVIGWTLPTNGGQAMAIVAAVLLGVTMPMTPAQILWVNMVTSVALGLVFAFDPAEPGVMQRPPRDPRAPLLSGLLVWRTALVSALFCVAIFAVFTWALHRGEELQHAQTFAVNTMVGLEIAYLFSVRLRSSPPFDFRAIRLTRALAIGIGVVIVLQALFTYLPLFETLYDTRPIDWPDMSVAALAAIGLILVLELEKAIRVGLFGVGRT
ncbi:MAG TPA: HAD-IC family P-type ATPase [Roseiarcus sp.]|nr:HAD-IC family P-type ATPase [Roseiarcus sp.]